ncbi:hypothetical protein OQA88_2985 [Cercophora sp. LCS_1]
MASNIYQDDVPVVAVIGVGYVGTHLVEGFSGEYRVFGFEVSAAWAAQLRQEEKFRSKSNVSFTTDLKPVTHFLISVPTLLRSDRTVGTSYLESVLNTYARPGATIVIKSSRVDPGRTGPPLTTVPEIISGLDSASLTSITRLYSPIFQSLIPVSPEVAAMTKLYENC